MQRSKRIIGVSEQHRRHGEAQRLGRFEVDQQVEFDGQLDRQIGRVGAPEDAVNVSCRLLERFGTIFTIGDQATWLRAF
jgi:carbohydrate-selective porin OprB